MGEAGQAQSLSASSEEDNVWKQQDMTERASRAQTHLSVLSTWAQFDMINPARDNAKIENWAYEAHKILGELTTPRVLEPKELFRKHPDGEPILIELRNGDTTWTLYDSYIAAQGYLVVMIPTGELVIRKKRDYGISWRAWTLRPSEADKKSLKWDDEPLED